MEARLITREALEVFLKFYENQLSRDPSEDEIRKSREYWGSMPWHPKGMVHPSLVKK